MEFIQRFSEPTFAKMVNIGFLIAGRPHRIRFDKETEVFIFEGEMEYGFVHKSRIILFFYGPVERGAIIGEEYLLSNIEFFDGDCIVDCGANIGDLLLYFTSIKVQICMIAIEPSPLEYTLLQRNIERNACVKECETYNLALWKDANARADFYVKSGSADSSLFEVNDFEEKISIRTERLDALIPRKRYRLLKVEAEGAEPEVLEGAEAVLDCFDYIVVDAGFERGLAQETTLRDVTRFLLGKNFEFVDINPKRVCVLFRRIQ